MKTKNKRIRCHYIRDLAKTIQNLIKAQEKSSVQSMHQIDYFKKYANCTNPIVTPINGEGKREKFDCKAWGRKGRR